MAEQDHPFQPGTRVAIRGGWNHDQYSEAFVEKVYKTGHFTLRGNSQRWRPYKDSGWGRADLKPRWLANETGHRYSRLTVLLWDDETDNEIAAAVAETARRRRWSDLAEKVSKLRGDDITDALCDAIEAALPKPKQDAA